MRVKPLSGMRILLALFALALSHPVFSQEAPLPQQRPDPLAQIEVEAPLVPMPRLRPEARPPEPEPPAVAAPAADDHVEAPKPPRIYQAACPAVLLGLVEATILPPIAENQCQERSPLTITGVLANGRMIPFTGEAILNCGMATALPAWAEAVDSYLLARENTRIQSIIIGTSYMCRPRNNAATGDTSEHGFANALDVVGFRLEDGRSVTLPDGWGNALSPEGRLLRFAHDAGCSQFTTTLGPEANGQHHDHLHLDLGCHGQACTARLCE